MRKKDGNVGLSRLCFFARSSELSIRRRSQDSHTPGSPSPSSIDASMLLLDWCSPSFHRHDYINQKARRTLFLSRLISLCLLPLLPLLLLLFSSVRWRGYALSNRWMTDENVLNTEQDEHSIVVFDEKGESGRTSTCTPSFSIDETRLSFHSSLPHYASPLFSAYYSVQRGCKACLLVTVSSWRL